jgi:Zn-dependent protease with chaperone function
MADFKSAVTDELKAVVAHELAHLKRGDMVGMGTAVITKYTPYACLIAGIGVTAYLLHQSHKKQGQEAKDSGNPDTIAIQSPTLETAKAVGKLLLGAIAGTGVGVGITTLLRHRMEYKCDAFSKHLMGSGEPLARVLENMEAHYSGVLKKMVADSKFTPEQAKQLEIFGNTIDCLSHPSTEKRIAALRGI